MQEGIDYVSLSPSTTLYRVIEGEQLEAITCLATCIPACTYTWSTSGKTVSATGTLDLGQAERRDAGTYMCTVQNTISRFSKNGPVVSLDVIYGPDKVTLSPSTTLYRVAEGNNLAAITCFATCNPACTYTWSKSGSRVSSTATLYLRQIERREDGSYICTVLNPESSISKNGPDVRVDVIYGPTSLMLNPSTLRYIKNEGDKLGRITCSADCFPECNILWRKTSGVSYVVSNNAYLSIGKLDRTERGTYRCEAINRYTRLKTTNTITVHVRYGPDDVTLNVPNFHTVTEGNAVNNINCSADCWPRCVFTWSNLANKQLVSSSAVLNFRTARRDDAGDYKCLARNSAYEFSGEAEKHFTLSVQYSPDVFISESSALLNENTPLDLLCKASGEPAVYNYTGFLQRVNGIVIPNSHVESLGVKESISVNIPSLQLQDTGLYTCFVHNGIIGINKQLIQTASQRVEVQASPQLLLEKTNFAGETSGNITVAVPFVSIPEYTTYSVLRHDGHPVLTNGKYSLHIRNESVYPLFYGKQVKLTGNVLEIIISDLSEKDFGIYNIQITNDINTAKISIDVKATSKPSQPTELNINTLDNIASLDWKKGFNGGHEQTFVLQTSLNLDDSWTNKTVINESDSKYIKENGRFQVQLTNLVPGIYSARLLAFNIIGDADPVEFKDQFEIKELNEEKQTPIPGALIGGTAGGGICVIVLVIVVVIIFLRKRKTQKGQEDSDLTNGQKLENLSHRTQPDDDNIPDEVDNPMYVSGDDVDIPKATTTDIYATPDKKKRKQNEGAGDIYAVVDKKKKTKHKGNITGIYGNIDNIQITKQNNCAGDKSQKKRVHKDDLVYAEVVHANPSKGKKKLVINDIEDVTEYAQVKLTSRADPFPDNDGKHEK
ncbi:hemicentin-1-like [Mya arenaria]|uniref:hemicentin-1-like n=1 Tax=Mya arenaria TaxID=6604 RepID=UPI0022E3C922|nr:hemicentin-1-like [Mya arenaria]